MIYLSRYMDRWHFIAISCIIGGFIFAGMFIFSHLLVLNGAVRERAEKECVSATAITNWERALEIAQSICVDSQENYKEDISGIYTDQIIKLEEEAKYWKDSYFWLKKQQEETAI